jgi:hypothetical protein
MARARGLRQMLSKRCLRTVGTGNGRRMPRRENMVNRVRTSVHGRLLAGVIVASAVLPFAVGAGPVVAGAEGGGDVPPAMVVPAVDPVLDEMLSGQEALAGLDIAELAEVAEEVGWSADQLSSELALDDSLHVTPDGELLYVESGAEFANAAPESAESAGASAAVSAAAAMFSDSDTFTLHSLPGSNRVVYLDFAGIETVDPQFKRPVTITPFDLDGSHTCPIGTVDTACFSEAELATIREIWARVAEAYSAFEVDVTTEDPGVAALSKTDCYGQEDPDGNVFWTCPDGITREVGDQHYGARISFTFYSDYCGFRGAAGCGYLGSLDESDSLRAYFGLPPKDPKGIVATHGFGPNVTTAGLASVAIHEIGHVVGLAHEANPETGGYECTAPPGTLWQPVMRRCFGPDRAPIEQFTPNICRDEPQPLGFSFPLCERDLVELDAGAQNGLPNRIHDSYGWMASHGLVARVDEASPVAVPAPSFEASGVISPPVLTGPRFYAPLAPHTDFGVVYGGPIGPGRVELVPPGVLLIADTDAGGNDLGTILDTLDDDNSPLRTFVTLFNPNNPWFQNETWAVDSVATGPGYRVLTGRRVSHSGRIPFGPLFLRVHGTGESGPMDTDVYTFSVPAGAGPTSISVTPSAFSKLDVKATVYDDQMSPVAVSDPPAVRVDSDLATGLDASITATLAPGDYALEVAGAALGGVYPSYGSIGSYTMSIHTQVPQTVEFTSAAPTDAVVGGATYAPTAVASSGLDVTITVDAASAGVCSMTAGEVSFDGAGTCTLNADQAGNSTYFPAAQAQQSFAVTKQSQTVAFTSAGPSGAVVGGPTYTPTASASSGLDVAITVDATAAGVCTITAGAVSFVGAGTCTLNADQPGNAAYSPSDPVQQSFSVFQAPAFVLANPPTAGTVGAPYSYTFQANGVPTPSYALAAGAPAWLSIDSGNGSLIGTPPTGSTSFTYSVVATNTVGTATGGPFTVLVTTPPPSSTRADVSITLSCPSTVRINVSATCSATVRNAGPAIARNVVTVLTLPAALNVTSVSAGGVTVGNIVGWTQPQLAANASATFSVTVRSTSARRVTISGAVASRQPDPNYANNIASASIGVIR